VVEGPIGAGKTSLARRLSEHVGKSLLLEDRNRIPSLRVSTKTSGAMRWRRNCFFLFQRRNRSRA